MDYITANEVWSCVGLAGGAIMLLWSYAADTPTAEQRILHNQWLALTRDALANARTIEFTHNTGSALATQVRID